MKPMGKGFDMTTYRTPQERSPIAQRPPVGVALPPAGTVRHARPLPVPREQLRTRVPWTALSDASSLLVAVLATTASLGGVGQESRLLLVALIASSLFVWVLFMQFRSLATIIRRQRSGVYGMPVVAALATAVVLGAGGVELSWSALAVHTVTWTGGLALGRVLLTRRRAPLRVLLIGSPPFLSELTGRSDIEVTCLKEPPARVNGWNVVATDPAENYSREWLQWISHADMHDIKVISAPLLLETLTGRVPTEMLHGRWAFEVLDGRSRYQFWKRSFDVLGVVLAAPLLLPIAGVVALVVWRNSGRPILFFQDRVGLGGRAFRMVKFRTMVTHAEENGSAFALDDDPRITPAGAFLRQYRLDELPQFWNVLRGEMSIIGPRPEQLVFADQFDDEIPLYQLRHNVRPGITGWAQVRHGYAAGAIETGKKLRYDFYYVKHCSLGLDLVIVWRTILTILTGFGAR